MHNNTALKLPQFYSPKFAYMEESIWKCSEVVLYEKLKASIVWHWLGPVQQHTKTARLVLSSLLHQRGTNSIVISFKAFSTGVKLTVENHVVH